MATKPEQSNIIPKVLMVSSAAFGVFSAINPYMAIPCAIAGLGSNLLDNQTMTEVSKDLNQELIEAAKNALDAACNEMKDNKNYSPSQLRIIEELSETEVQPQNFKSLIKKAESFQRYYCTEKDSDDIIRLFEKHLGVEIAGNSLLIKRFGRIICVSIIRHNRAIA